jgi:hypothetical protein
MGLTQKGLNCFQTGWEEGPNEENLLIRKESSVHLLPHKNLLIGKKVQTMIRLAGCILLDHKSK